MRRGKGELAQRVHRQTGLNEETAKAAVDAVLEGIRALTSDDDVLILRGFGTFAVYKRRASVTRNPRTGERMDVPASQRLGFKASRERGDD